MNTKDTGGPAFPAQHFDLAEGEHGLTIRDWFAAHAPFEPQPWFEPTMPMPRPKLPLRPTDFTDEERVELEGWGDYYDTKDLKSPRVKEYATAFDAAKKESVAWDKEAVRQRYVQWPFAWADAMLKARQA